MWLFDKSKSMWYTPSNKSDDDNFWPFLGNGVKNTKKKKMGLVFMKFFVINHII